MSYTPAELAVHFRPSISAAESSFVLYFRNFTEKLRSRKRFRSSKKDIKDKKKNLENRERMAGPLHHFHIILFIVYQTDIPDISCRYIS